MPAPATTRNISRAALYSLSALLAVAIPGSFATPASAQLAHEASTFSSSTDAGISEATAGSEGIAAAAERTYSSPNNSYGEHHRNVLDKLTFEAGGGMNAPAGDSSSYITWGGNLTIGAGYHIMPHVSLLGEYQFIDDKLPGVIIGETGADGGNAHIWSLTLAPVIDLFPHRANDVYVTGGGGFYRKVTNFTDPQSFEYCTYYYCGIDTENAVVGHFSSNQGGWNVGAGFTHRLGGMNGESRLKLFAEARYLDIDTPAVQSSPNGLGTTTIAAGTKLIPITLGVRF